MDFSVPVDDVTVVMPLLRGSNPEWLEQAKGGFPQGQRLCVVENDGEMAEALNDAIRNHVETPWVYRFDADDVASEGLLHMLRDAAWDEPDVVYPAMVLADRDTLRPVGIHHADIFCARRLELHNFVSGASLFRRSRFIEAGGYRDLEALEDWDLWLRMARLGCRFKAAPEAFFLYRQSPTSRNRMSADTQKRLAREITGLGEGERQQDAEATFYYQGTPYTAYLRCATPARYLPAVAQPVYMIPSSEHEEQPAFRFPDHRGAAVFQFGATQMESLVMRWMQLNGHPVFIEVDDDYTADAGRITERAGWQRKVLQPDRKTGEVRAERQRPSIEGHLRMVRSADGVICATEHLASRYRRHNPNVWVCPNQVDPDDWPERSRPVGGDGVLRIGWLASGSHRNDWLLVAKALRWACRQKNVRVVLMGVEVDEPGLEYELIPWMDDWNVYRVACGTIDVGLAPVVATPWSLGRSDLKALDYAVMGACPVLQDEPIYEAWTAGETCLKARAPDDWLRVVKHLVYNRERIVEIAERAREYVLAERTFEGNAWRWRQALASAAREPVAA